MRGEDKSDTYDRPLVRYLSRVKLQRLEVSFLSLGIWEI
jgi:hypothetical protein